MKFVGIDPGAKGGMAVIEVVLYGIDFRPCIKVIKLLPFNEIDYVSTLSCLNDDNDVADDVAIEAVHAMPNQGVTSMFNFGKSYGWLRGIVDMAGFNIFDVPPQRWKKFFGLLNKDKSASIKMAKHLFGNNINLFPTSRCRKESDGMAEALLIALYSALTSGLMVGDFESIKTSFMEKIKSFNLNS